LALARAADDILAEKDSTTYPAAKRLYEQAIADGSLDDRACAAVGLATLLKIEDAAATKTAAGATWEQKLQKDWASWTKKHLEPLEDSAAAVAAILILLLVIARLMSGVFVPARPASAYEKPSPEPLGENNPTFAAKVRKKFARFTGAADRHTKDTDRPSEDPPAPRDARAAASRREAIRRAWWAGGLALLVLAALSPVIAGRATLEDSWWWPVGLAVTALLVVVALAAWPEREGNRAPLTIGLAGAVAAVVSAAPLALDPTLVTGAWAATTGVTLVAMARGRALAIEVQARGSSGTDNSSHARLVVSRLQELGSENPRDIRVLNASDVTALPEDALTAVPSGAFATALFNILKVVRPSAPWRVSVCQPDASTMVLDITRNGTTVPGGSLVVTTADLPSPEASNVAKTTGAGASKATPANDLDDLLTVAAAHTLLTLSQPHRELKVGLCGADHWLGLAGHAIASRPAVDTERKKALLRAAVDSNPKFILARMAAANTIDDTDPAGREEYAARLNMLWQDFTEPLGEIAKAQEPKPGFEAAQLRLLYNLSVAWMNVRFDRAIKLATKAGSTADTSAAKAAADSDDYEPVVQAWQASTNAALSLSKRLKALREGRVEHLAALVEESVIPAYYLLADLLAHKPSEGTDVTAFKGALTGLVPADKKKQPSADTEKLPAAYKEQPTADSDEVTLADEKNLLPETRNDYYGRACYRASHPDSEHWPKAIEDLRIAITAPGFAQWAPHDPSLAVFTSRNESGHRALDGDALAFKRLVAPKPPASYLDLPLFKPHAEVLKARGLTSLEDIAAASTWELVLVAKVHPTAAKRWIEAAKLHKHIGERAELDDSDRLQLLQVLLALDVTSVEKLEKKADSCAERRKFYLRMVDEASDLRIRPTWSQTIKRWFQEEEPPEWKGEPTKPTKPTKPASATSARTDPEQSSSAPSDSSQPTQSKAPERNDAHAPETQPAKVVTGEPEPETAAATAPNEIESAESISPPPSTPTSSTGTGQPPPDAAAEEPAKE
jgi:hypothetical protein